VLGFLPGYIAEERLGTGRGFFLLDLIGRFVVLPGWAILPYMGLTLGVLALLAARFVPGPPLPVEPAQRIDAVARHAVVLGTALMLALSPHYPWYFGWLAPLACLAPFRSVLYLLAASPLLYLDPVHNLLPPALVYVPCIILALRDLQGRRQAAAPILAHSARSYR
jgi:hypothetical protein